jgi:2-polyprenyl-6-methoxyphenol hydroxylase-like FAD-dependent oxidoreductase
MRILIIGAGLGGLCLAQRLLKAGLEVEVIERNAATADNLAGYGSIWTTMAGGR